MIDTKTLDAHSHVEMSGFASNSATPQIVTDEQIEAAFKWSNFGHVKVDGIEAAACVCDAEGARWRKKAQKHLPHHSSDYARHDIERAEICEKLAKKIREILAEPV